MKLRRAVHRFAFNSLFGVLYYLDLINLDRFGHVLTCENWDGEDIILWTLKRESLARAITWDARVVIPNRNLPQRVNPIGNTLSTTGFEYHRRRDGVWGEKSFNFSTCHPHADLVDFAVPSGGGAIGGCPTYDQQSGCNYNPV